MPKTYAQLAQEIDALKTKAEAVRQQEKAGVTARIREAIAIYGITFEELGFAGKASSPNVARKPAMSWAPGTTAPAEKLKSTAKYRDDAGNTWSGMGPKPGWLKAALAGGQSLESLSVRDERRDAARVSDVGAAPQLPKAPPKKSKKVKSIVKYRDDAGHEWSGRGPKPRWVNEAIAGGKTLEQLAA